MKAWMMLPVLSLASNFGIHLSPFGQVHGPRPQWKRARNPEPYWWGEAAELVCNIVTAGSIGKVFLTWQLSNHVWWPSWEDTCWRKRKVILAFCWWNLQFEMAAQLKLFINDKGWIKATNWSFADPMVLQIPPSNIFGVKPWDQRFLQASSWFSHLQINMGGPEKECGSGVYSVCPDSQKVMVSWINRDVSGGKILVSFGMLPLLVEVTSEGNMSVALETLDVMSS